MWLEVGSTVFKVALVALRRCRVRVIQGSGFSRCMHGSSARAQLFVLWGHRVLDVALVVQIDSTVIYTAL